MSQASAVLGQASRDSSKEEGRYGKAAVASSSGIRDRALGKGVRDELVRGKQPLRQDASFMTPGEAAVLHTITLRANDELSVQKNRTTYTDRMIFKHHL